VVTFVFKGEAKLRAVGGDFAVFDHEIQFDHLGDALLSRRTSGAASFLLPFCSCDRVTAFRLRVQR
jgi:hypothetical protein